MALQKQVKAINFSEGLDTKTDDKQVAPGKFLFLQNTVFNKGGLLQKRSGYGPLTTLANDTSNFITTFNGNLTAVGEILQAYSQGSNTWVDKGDIEPVKLSTLPIIRNNTNQSQADTAIASNGLMCTVYTDDVPSGSVIVPQYKFVVADSVTGQNITSPALLTATLGTIVGSPRIFTLGKYFVIVFTNLIAGIYHLSYVAINSINPTQVLPNVSITSNYVPSSTLSFDGVVANNSLYLAWAAVANTIRMVYIDSTLALSSPAIFIGKTATIMSVTADNSTGTPTIYASFYDSVSQDGYTLAVDHILNTVLAPVHTITGESLANITSSANNALCTILYEVKNSYGYDSSIETNYIKVRTITQSGTLGTPAIVIRSVGLASKAFMVNGDIYFLSIYNSQFQPSYFLIKHIPNNVGNVVANLAISNGGSYYTVGLPIAIVNNMLVRIPYFIKDQIQAVNKTQGLSNAAGIYSQTGINLASFTIGAPGTISAEIGSNLNLSGGILRGYDGYSTVENGFFLWPDYVETTTATTGGQMSAQKYFYVATYEWSDNQGNVFRSAPSIPVVADLTGSSPTPVVFTSTFTAGVSSITVSSVAGLAIGQVITDTTTGANISVGTYITSIVGLVLGLSQPTAGASGAPDTLQTVTTCSVTVDVPTLRLTYKINNPVKLVLYRWSVSQQTYYQTTSIILPILNDPTVDYIAIVDKNADNQILGNNILYTTGGVLENIAPPASDTLALFQSRLFMIDAEDKNLLWYSKQVIENTPVEMSDLLTIYAAPSISAQGNTGPLLALSAMDDKLILFKKDAIYYITGTGPDNTGANSQFSDPIFITATVGCANQKSIVFLPQGLMFQSDKGIWLLGRDLSTNYIGAPVEAFTASALVQSAVNVPGTNQVRFTLDSGITLMYDYYYGQWGTFINVPAVSSTLYQGLHTYLNSSGQVFQETPGLYLDGSNPVLIKFTTSWLNLAGLQGYERLYFFYILAQYISPHKLSVSIAYDYNPSPTQTSLISPDNFNKPWGGLAQWGSSPEWGGNPALEQWRVFPQQQKCQAFQLTISEAYDSSLGIKAGAGFTMSGIDMVLGMKSGYPRLRPSKSVG